MFEEESEKHNYKNLPVFRKAREIVDLSNKIAEFIIDSMEQKLQAVELGMAKSYVHEIVSNSYLLPVKIAGAESVQIYDLKMENAALIRKAAREISTLCSGLQMFDIDGFNYLKMLQEEINLFRIEFAEWVKTFDQYNYIIDRWGLFNPPGINYDDKDLDDDIPM